MTDLKKLFRGAHPFVSEPGEWIVAGHSLSGHPLERVPIQGTVRISHEGGKILSGGRMSVVSRTHPVTFQNSYDMTPTEDELALDFFQANEPVGDLRGKVVAFDDRLISSYVSGNGSLAGCEVLHRMGDNHYALTGTLIENGRLATHWKLDLVRPGPESRPESDPSSGEA